MGCSASIPQDVDILPIKAHCRTAFSRSLTIEQLNSQSYEKFPASQAGQGYDVILCYPLGGKYFAVPRRSTRCKALSRAFALMLGTYAHDACTHLFVGYLNFLSIFC